jgi:Protein of unknown function (DUF2795)
VTDQNTTHSPRVDDQLAHDVAALTHGGPDDGRTEWRRDQASGDDEALAGVTRDDSDAELVQRSQLAACLAPASFPVTAAALANLAEGNDAPARMVDALRALPGDSSYDTFAELWVALGGEVERRS